MADERPVLSKNFTGVGSADGCCGDAEFRDRAEKYEIFWGRCRNDNRQGGWQSVGMVNNASRQGPSKSASI